MDVSSVQKKEVCHFRDKREGQNTLARVKVTAPEKVRLRLDEQKATITNVTKRIKDFYTIYSYLRGLTEPVIICQGPTTCTGSTIRDVYGALTIFTLTGPPRIFHIAVNLPLNQLQFI